MRSALRLGDADAEVPGGSGAVRSSMASDPFPSVTVGTDNGARAGDGGYVVTIETSSGVFAEGARTVRNLGDLQEVLAEVRRDFGAPQLHWAGKTTRQNVYAAPAAQSPAGS